MLTISRSLIVAFVTSLILLVQTGLVRADREDNIELMRKIYAEISATLAVDTNSLEKAGTFLVLAPAGGILVDQKLNPADNQDRAIINLNLSDIVINESWILSISPNVNMSDVYRRVIAAETKTPNFQLTEAEEKLYNSIDNKYFYRDPEGKKQKRAILKDFQEKENTLLDAIDKIAQFQRENPGIVVSKSLLRILQNAKDEYNNIEGSAIRGELQKREELNSNRGEQWKSDLQERFNANYNLDLTFGETLFYPNYGNWFSEDSTWTKMNITSTDLEKRSHSKHTETTAGLSGGWGLWSWGGSYASDEKEGSKQEKATNLSLSFEVLTVRMRHNWMDFSILASRAWDWGQTSLYFGKKLSDGIYNPGTGELLPFIPTTLIVVRNVKLTADWSFKLEEFFEQRKQAGGSVRWGPFSLGGRNFSHEKKEYSIAQAKGNTVEFKNPQVIGYFVAQVPNSPNPNPVLPWGILGVDILGVDIMGPKKADPLIDSAEKLLKGFNELDK